ncbi:MAG TPA: 4-(cytidine 5'-diphospho)-2-C-methyl-D-erythritol kinase [Ignavibacteriaceae bacterium]|nr:4-(cytidine 5'-diphospho)-2-C-methyl-D-erythritol kinase [Ignavibacteriaceae bacterium]
MDKITVESPAKINLGLNVVRKRDDGYHDLETIFLPIMLSDRITFCKSDKLMLRTDSVLLNELKDNIILKAIRLLEKQTNKTIALDIVVKKVIPIGGGLGGGSSNAATTLKTVNKMFDLGLSYHELSKLALDLGSDVPYFLNPVSSYAESRGELLYPLNIEIPYPILIINPRIKIDTAWAFKRIKPVTPVKNLRQIFQKSLDDFDKLKSYVKNDFEEVVFNEFPLLKQIKEELYKQGAEFSLMSGTGSTVYGIFSNLQKAYWAEEFFKQKYFTFLNNPFTKRAIT